ncbi:MAG: VCBS repeat-containing protein [Geminicoccaceae bacterium]
MTVEFRTLFLAIALCASAASAQAADPVSAGRGAILGITGVVLPGGTYDITFASGTYRHLLPDIFTDSVATSAMNQINQAFNSIQYPSLLYIGVDEYRMPVSSPVGDSVNYILSDGRYAPWDITTRGTTSLDFTDFWPIFFTTKPACQWVYSSGGAKNFQNVAGGYALSKLAFGDFDGDGKTDVFYASPITGGFQWKYSSGGAKTFQNLAQGPYPDGFGDFDGDGKTDAFYAQFLGRLLYQWKYSSGAAKTFVKLAIGRKPTGFGDFDGDGKTDVFYADGLAKGGYQWKYSSGGVKAARNLAQGPYPDGFGDFDGDGKTDVFYAQPLTGGAFRWKYSSGGATTFRYLARGPAISYLRFGDFNGDGKTDVFSANGAYCR